MKQITKEQAVQIAESSSWKKLNPLQLAGFQLYQRIVFCDFGVFHGYLNEALKKGENFGNEGIRFRLEKSEDLQKNWEEIHNIPDFDHIMSILFPSEY